MEKCNITVDADRIEIHNFETYDHEIVAFFNSLEQNILPSKLENVLKMGITAAKSIDVGEKVSYVDKAFESLNSELKHNFDNIFAKGGDLPARLEEVFGKDGKIIKELFDPETEGSPLYKLQKTLSKDLVDIRNNLQQSKGAELVEEKSTQKGVKFEDQCQEKLTQIARYNSDDLERTSTDKETSSKFGSKSGDFVITLSDTDKKIVFEMKSGKIGDTAIRRELKDAMDNRNAQFGILVAQRTDLLPNNVGPFKAYANNQLACSVENENGDVLINGDILHLAYKWAKANILLDSAKYDKFDASFVREKSTLLEQSLKKMRVVKKDCTNIRNISDKIRNTVDETANEMQENLDELIESLSAK